MNAHAVACHLFEPDGTPLAAGTAEVDARAAIPTAVVTALDRPGRIVQRCLVGGLQRLRLQLDGGTPVAVLVERIVFDPRRGRVCTLRFDPLG
jgi:hypothetical protein